MKNAFAALSLLVLAGCQTMSPDECRYANWNDIGLRDGLAGKPLSLLGDRTQDCNKAGSQVDTHTYLAGRDQGLLSYCRIENAAQLGLNGDSYAGVCPAMIDVEFRRHFQAGRMVHDLRARVSDLDGRAERLQHRLREADADEDKQLKSADKDEDRQRIRKDFDERRQKLRHELADNDRDSRRARDDLRDAERALDAIR